MAMLIEQRAFQGASWLAVFKAVGQIVSWFTTVIVARILVPEDYGLMAMATLITGYAAIFSELGLGAAIIQRPSLTKEDLTSVFWFGFGFSILLAVFAFIAAWPTALIFNNNNVIPITRATSILFLIAGLQIVPLNILKKDLEFKKIGIIEMVATVISCISMEGIASANFGVWTLIIGHMIRDSIKLLLVYRLAGWKPIFYFDLNKAKSFIRFGLSVAFGNSLYYVYSKSDKFFAGRSFGAVNLGLYTFAQQLSSIPTEKIVVLINQVSFPVFSKLQGDQIKFNKFYLNIIKITSTIVFPLFIGGFLLGEDLVRIVLSAKWLDMIQLFKYFCLIQIITSLNAINNFVHTSKGNPHFGMWFNAWLAFSMTFAFAFSVQFGVNWMLVPWFTIYLLSCVLWIKATVKIIGESIMLYFRQLLHPVMGTMLMSIVILVLTGVFSGGSYDFGRVLFLFWVKLIAGGVVYLCYFYFFDRGVFVNLKKIFDWPSI